MIWLFLLSVPLASKHKCLNNSSITEAFPDERTQGNNKRVSRPCLFPPTNYHVTCRVHPVSVPTASACDATLLHTLVFRAHPPRMWVSLEGEKNREHTKDSWMDIVCGLLVDHAEFPVPLRGWRYL